jgi:1-acyl-sn-glycerol-3-phosphate acyltransferase
LGGIFVNRDSFNFDFIGESIEALDKGQSIGIFPQARLPVNNIKFPFAPSVVMIALRTDAPIIPVFTDGRYGIFKRASVLIGKPIYLKELCDQENPSGEKIEELRSFLEKRVEELGEILEEKTKNGK